MTLIELNKIIDGKYVEELSVKTIEKNRCATDDEHQVFKHMLAVNDAYSMNLNATEDYKEFFDALEFFAKVFPECIREDLFYAAKLGFRFNGVPSKLTYLLRKAISAYNSPNVAMSAIDTRAWGRFLKKGSLPEGVTIKMVVENLLGVSYDTILDYRLKVKFKDWYEVYVANVDRVVLLPEAIAKNVDSLVDLKHIEYIQDVGVTLYGKPLRAMEPFYGVTRDDFDLRQVI